MDLSELSSYQEASLFTTHLEEWQDGPQVITYGAILICRKGKATVNINYKEWHLHEGAVITVFPNDVVELKVKSEASLFDVEMLKYNASLLREASLQLEQTVSSLREVRCRQDTPVVTNIIDSMFALLKVYFNQSECTCISQLVLLQLKAFFVGFHEYLQRNPQNRPDDEVKSYRVRELFNRFMMLMERDYKLSRDVNYYADLMHITSKYLTNIVRQVAGHTPKTIIDQYVILQLKMQLQRSSQSIKEIAWEYHFTDVSFFCRYFKKHTGLTPQQMR